MGQVMKSIFHGVLEGGTNIFEGQGHNSLYKCPPWSCESCFVLDLGVYLDLIITGEAMHQREEFMDST
jgi:hypothetical protein